MITAEGYAEHIDLMAERAPQFIAFYKTNDGCAHIVGVDNTEAGARKAGEEETDHDFIVREITRGRESAMAELGWLLGEDG